MLIIGKRCLKEFQRGRCGKSTQNSHAFISNGPSCGTGQIRLDAMQDQVLKPSSILPRLDGNSMGLPASGSSSGYKPIRTRRMIVVTLFSVSLSVVQHRNYYRSPALNSSLINQLGFHRDCTRMRCPLQSNDLTQRRCTDITIFGSTITVHVQWNKI